MEEGRRAGIAGRAARVLLRHSWERFIFGRLGPRPTTRGPAAAGRLGGRITFVMWIAAPEGNAYRPRASSDGRLIRVGHVLPKSGKRWAKSVRGGT
jgi:hypothetical protein